MQNALLERMAQASGLLGLWGLEDHLKRNRRRLPRATSSSRPRTRYKEERMRTLALSELALEYDEKKYLQLLERAADEILGGL